MIINERRIGGSKRKTGAIAGCRVNYQFRCKHASIFCQNSIYLRCIRIMVEYISYCVFIVIFIYIYDQIYYNVLFAANYNAIRQWHGLSLMYCIVLYCQLDCQCYSSATSVMHLSVLSAVAVRLTKSIYAKDWYFIFKFRVHSGVKIPKCRLSSNI